MSVTILVNVADISMFNDAAALVGVTDGTSVDVVLVTATILLELTDSAFISLFIDVADIITLFDDILACMTDNADVSSYMQSLPDLILVIVLPVIE